MTLLAIAAGATLGSFLGNTLTLFVVGLLVKRNEEKQQAEVERLRQGYLEMAQRERTRLENYARMEG